MADNNPEKSGKITFRKDQTETKIFFRLNKTDAKEITNPDGSPLRNKDNAQLKPKPPQGVTRPARNLAPPGMSGIRTGLKQPVQRSPEPQKPASIPRGAGQVDPSQWIDGKITTMKGYEFQAKMTDEPSKHGIDGGKISQLDVRKDGELVMRYDRGWDKDPQTPEQKEALQRIRNGLDDSPQKQFKGFGKGANKDHGMDV
ncbi:MAG: hypothetical protein ABJL72_01600 [Roseobacter sp.]